LICGPSGVDNVIELNVVTSTGKYITANSHKHADLFWALRGGGGGTYGIVTSVTYRTHPSVPLTGVFFSANTSNNATFKRLFTEFVRIHPDLSDAGFSGYAATFSNALQVVYIAPNMSQIQANRTIDPFFAFAKSLTSEGLDIELASTTPFESFYSWHTQLYSSDEQVGGITEMASRLIPRDVIESNHEGVADAFIGLSNAYWVCVSNKPLNFFVGPNS
jgi:hypothetical protein